MSGSSNGELVNKKPEALVEVTILVDGHYHQDQPVEKGGKISVTPEEREWLISINAVAAK